MMVLNLIINGLPSILNLRDTMCYCIDSFKPYYKWITFNTQTVDENDRKNMESRF